MILISLQDNNSRLGTGFGVHETSTDSVFGTSIPQVVKKTTIWLSSIYFVLSILISDITSWYGRKLYIKDKNEYLDTAQYDNSFGSNDKSDDASSINLTSNNVDSIAPAVCDVNSNSISTGYDNHNNNKYELVDYIKKL